MKVQENPNGHSLLLNTALLYAVVVVVLILVPAGFLLLTPEVKEGPNREEDLLRLAENRALWESSKPSAAQYVVARGGSMRRQHWYYPYIAKEDHGFRTAVYPEIIIVKGIGVLSAPRDPVWIDDIFELIDSSVNDGAKLKVRYDTKLGFPTDVRVHWACADCDDAVKIYDFEVLQDNHDLN